MHKKKNTWAKAIQAKQIFSQYSYIPTTDNPVLCQMYLVMQKAIDFATDLYQNDNYLRSLNTLQTASQKFKAKNGDDLIHQLLEFEADYVDERIHSKESMLECINNSSKYNTNAFRLTMNLLEQEQTLNKYYNSEKLNNFIGEAFLGVATRFFLIPYPTCNYSRISDDAVNYLVSLGQPSHDLRESFLDYLELMASESHNDNYEEVITFDINDQPNAIYFGFRRNFVYRFHYTVEDVEMSVLPKDQFLNGKFTQQATCHYDTDGSTAPEELDIDDWSFLINLWAAKQHNDFVVGNEHQSNQSTVAEQINSICKKPNWSKYSYVHISDAGREAFNEARQIITQYRGNAEYKKTMWFTRAYYARRGKNGIIVLNKASIHHRKCATPSEGTNITVYT